MPTATLLSAPLQPLAAPKWTRSTRTASEAAICAHTTTIRGTSMAQLISHGECGKQWSGQNRSHCPACHETFSGETAADKHRKGKFGPHSDRHCLTPEAAGLVAAPQPWGVLWRNPGDDTRAFATRTAAAQ